MTAIDWMSALNGSKKLNRLTIPGSHDTGSMHYLVGHDYDQCQDWSYRVQLYSGLRFLDIRLVLVPAQQTIQGIPATPDFNFAVHHSSDYQGSYFDRESSYANNPDCSNFVLQQCIEFLDQHPTECIIMSIKQEKPAFDLEIFQDALKTIVRLHDREGRYFWVDNRVPTLDEARGRIVIVNRLNDGSAPAGFAWYGIPWPNWDKAIYQTDGVDVEDHYKDTTTAAKWGKVKDHLDKASGKAGPYGADTDDFWYVTFVSCAPGNASPRSWADTMNPLVEGYLNDPVNAPKGHTRLGTILMDFPPQAAIDEIITYAQGAYPVAQNICQWTGSTWKAFLIGGQPVRLAVAPGGDPYVVNQAHEVWRYDQTTGSGTQLPGSVKATDIGIGPDGSVWILGDDRADQGGSRVYKLSADGSRWELWPTGTGIRIAVGRAGLPYVISGTNEVIRCDGPSSWTRLPGVLATDLGVGPDDSVWTINANNARPPIGGYTIRRWNGAGWDLRSTGIPTGFRHISVDRDGLPYLVDLDQGIWHFNGHSSSTRLAGAAGDIGVGVGPAGGIWVVSA